MLILQPWQTLLKLLPLLGGFVLLAGVPLAMIVAAHRAWAGKRRSAFSDMSLLDALPYPVVIRDRALKVIACNSAYAAECGPTQRPPRGAAIGESLGWLKLEGIDQGELAHWYTGIAASGKPAFIDRTLLRDYAPVLLRHWASPIRDTAGRIQGLVAGWWDLSVQQYVLSELTRARQSSEAALRAKATFLASISHDIHTPMNAVVGLLELTLARASLNAVERQQLETALQAARSLLALLRDLLDLSRLEAGEFDLRPVATSLHSVVGEVADIYSPAARSKGLQLRTVIDPAVAASHSVDPLRLKQILNNLVSNAIRFSTKDPVVIDVRATAVRKGRQCVQFTVSDNGPGIAADALPRLFEPYAQEDGTREHGGVGLGLSICKGLVDAMGGHLRVYSRPLQGTRVRMRLSLAVMADAGADVVSVPARAPGPILVVDDNAANRMVLQHQLQALGHDVVCVDSGVRALQLADVQAFKLVICDCAMPYMDGVQFTRSLRSSGGLNAATPVLGYTAGVPKSDMSSLYDAGMNAVLVKPVALAALRQALQTYLATRPEPASSSSSGEPARADNA